MNKLAETIYKAPEAFLICGVMLMIGAVVSVLSPLPLVIPLLLGIPGGYITGAAYRTLQEKPKP